jgi:hypothetical protein
MPLSSGAYTRAWLAWLAWSAWFVFVMMICNACDVPVANRLWILVDQHGWNQISDYWITIIRLVSNSYGNLRQLTKLSPGLPES